MTTLAAFELLLDPVRRVDEEPDSVVFFRDEGDAWQLGVDRDGVLPSFPANVDQLSHSPPGSCPTAGTRRRRRRVGEIKEPLDPAHG